MNDIKALLGSLAHDGVEFILIGGVAASRPKDLEAIAELEAIPEERSRNKNA